ncbi:MalY/PatB family protein [Vibrio owensii]|uniref:MalY/PatB family protein n=1 Tax=Vibrio owensii TaxID=696485 RepID=UPI0022DE319E|nr:aminotransferase class I/II-fold pyridoxal phosphate-dependent enzyme [Vibrio owensii]MDA0380769.1 aminotransferase class I/II-fold pyridoxal phosphate-dependent enzyme [Vibrio owensii]
MYKFKHSHPRPYSAKWNSHASVLGRNVLPMSVADMDLPVCEEIRAAMIATAQRHDFGYAHYHSDISELVARWYETEFQCSIEAEDIQEIPGMLMTIGALIRHLTKEGDGVIIFSPVYHSFAGTIRDNHRQPIECSLIKGESGRYQINFELFEQQCREHTVVLLCNPHNPTGQCWTVEELEQLISIARRNGTVVISDEIHADFTYLDSKVPFTSIFSATADTDGIIAFYSGGKIFNLGGLFGGFAITKDTSLYQMIQTIIKELHWLPNVFTHEAMYHGFKYGRAYKQELILHIRKIHHQTIARIKNASRQISIPLPDAGYLIWIDMSSTGWSDKDIHEFFVFEAKLGVNSGPNFGTGGEGHIRMNCAVSDTLLTEAMSQLIPAIKRNKI